MTIQPDKGGPLDVLRDCLRNGHPPECPNAQSALAQVEALVEAARYLNERAKQDLPEWYSDDGEYTVEEFTYFIDFDNALAPFMKATP